MLASLGSLLTLGVILLASYGVGRPLARALRVDEDDRLGNLVWSLALGLVAAGMLLTGLGLAGWLYSALIGVLTCSGALLGLGEVRQVIVGRRTLAAQPTHNVAEAPQPWPAGCSPHGWMIGGLLVLAALAASGALIGALAPSTDGDALCYHLDLPKFFLSQHAITLPAYNDHGTFPLLVEVWYLWAMALDGGVAAQLVHWALGVLLALSGVVLATDLIGRCWAWAVGAVIVLTPGISNQMAAPLNDVGLVLFTTLALVAFRRAACDAEGPRWYVAAGAMLGAACGIKYTGLLFVAALAAAWLWMLLRQAGRRLELLQGGLIVAVIAASVAGPWYVRAAWHRGNPVYPFFSQHLGQPAPESLPERKTPHGWDVRSLASLPWQLTMHPERFGGRGHQLGPLFLLALPGLAFARRLRGLGLLLCVALLYFLMWYHLRQNVRFLYPLVPLLSVAVVWVLMELRRLPLAPRALGIAVFAGAMLLGMLFPLKRSLQDVAVAVGWETRQDYLARREPSFRAAARANALLRPGDRILSQDYRTYYFAAETIRESVFRRLTHYDRAIRQPLDLDPVLEEAGFTHLLLAEASGEGIRFNRRLTRLVEARQAALGKPLTPLMDYQFRDADGALRRYRLVQLR